MNATKGREWIKSEDAGYQPGKLLLDSVAGHWSVYKLGRGQWIAAHIVGGVCQNQKTFRTRRDAMGYAESR